MKCKVIFFNNKGIIILAYYFSLGFFYIYYIIFIIYNELFPSLVLCSFYTIVQFLLKFDC
jgi:hypothetical protein